MTNKSKKMKGQVKENQGKSPSPSPQDIVVEIGGNPSYVYKEDTEEKT